MTAFFLIKNCDYFSSSFYIPFNYLLSSTPDMNIWYKITYKGWCAMNQKNISLFFSIDHPYHKKGESKKKNNQFSMLTNIKIQANIQFLNIFSHPFLPILIAFIHHIWPILILTKYKKLLINYFQNLNL